MTDPVEPIAPTAINLHKKSRLLEITFSDGFRFNYSCEYLRVFAEEGEQDKPVHGKQRVDITSIEPKGTDLLQLDFDDGFSGSYFWGRLHELGVNYEQNWKYYIQKLDSGNLQRSEGRLAGPDGKVTIKLLYFIQLAKVTGKDDEDVEIPETVTNVETLLAWQRNRKEGWDVAFSDDKVQVTVNKHFSEPFTLVEHGDEVALVPKPE